MSQHSRVIHQTVPSQVIYIPSVLGKVDNCQKLHNQEIDPVSDDVECQYGKQTCAVSLGKMVHSGACGFSNCPTSEDTSLASSKASLLEWKVRNWAVKLSQ